MNRKILFTLLAVFIALVAIGAASAYDFSDIESVLGISGDQTITVNGEIITIPEGFKENKNINENETINYDIFSKKADYAKGYSNGTSFLNIFYTEYNGTLESDLSINYMNKTTHISGVEGILYEDDTGYTYSYIANGEVISIQSDNLEVIIYAIG